MRREYIILPVFYKLEVKPNHAGRLPEPKNSRPGKKINVNDQPNNRY